MRCPYCHQNIRVQGRFCPKCGQQIFGLPVARPPGQAPAPPGSPSPLPPPVAPEPPARPQYPPSDLGQDGLDIVVEGEGPAGAPSAPLIAGAHAAGGEEIGNICPYCRFPAKPGEQVYVCPACKVVHHLDCWRENQGCTTYGCRGATTVPGSQPAYQPPAGATAHPVGGLVPDFATLQVRELEGRANNALWMTLAGSLCCPPLTLVGLFMAIGLLGEFARMSVRGGKARGLVIAAIIVAVISILGWIGYLIAQAKLSSYGYG